jgi:hypothetical protein
VRPAELDTDDGGQHRRDQELGQRGHDGRPRALGAAAGEPASRPEPQGARADGPGREGGGRQRAGHQEQRHPERLGDGGGDLGAGDPGTTRVAARQAAEPLREEVQGPGVEAELLPDGGDRLG